MNTRMASMPTALRQSIRLTVVMAVLWGLLAGPAVLLAGQSGLEGLSYAVALCLAPGWVVFWLSSSYRVVDKQLFVTLAGTAIRLLFVLVGVVVIRDLRPELGLQEFLVWVVVAYLAALTAETWLVLKAGPESEE